MEQQTKESPIKIPADNGGVFIAHLLIFAAFAIRLAAFMVQRTWWTATVSQYVSHDTVRHFCLALLAIAEILFGRKDSRSLVGLTITAGLVAISVHVNYRDFIDGLCFIYVARDVEFKHLATFALIEMSLFFVVVVFAAHQGWISSPVYGHEGGRVRQTLGFGHPNTGPAFSVFIFMLWCYLRSSRFCWIDALGILSAEGALFHFTDSRTALMLTVVLVSLMCLYRYAPQKLQGSFIVRTITAGSVAFAATASLVVGLTFNPEVAWMSHLDSLMSGRPRLAHEALEEYGLPLIGEPVYFGQPGHFDLMTGKWVKPRQGPVVDNMYVRIGFNCGTLFLGVTVMLCTCVAWTLSGRKELALPPIIITAAIFGLAENSPSGIFYNTFLFLLTTPLAAPVSARLEEKSGKHFS